MRSHRRKRLAQRGNIVQNATLQKEAEFKKEQLLKPWVLSEKNKLDIKIYSRDKFKRDLPTLPFDNIKIAIYTSLSPVHANKDAQLTAVKSWDSLGMSIYSFNSKEELNALKTSYPSYVNFITCNKTSKHIFGKPCILINEMIDHFNDHKSADILMLINSDIILNPSEDLIKKIKSLSSLGIVISSRNDFKKDFLDGTQYVHGFDVFCIHNRFTKMFPPSIYSMGQTWWDYWIPYTSLKNRVVVFRITQPFAFHKEHEKQYNEKDWRRMTQYFRFENDLSEPDAQTLNNSIWKDIMDNSIVI